MNIFSCSVILILITLTMPMFMSMFHITKNINFTM